jgi:hypothetical protein
MINSNTVKILDILRKEKDENFKFTISVEGGKLFKIKSQKPITISEIKVKKDFKNNFEIVDFTPVVKQPNKDKNYCIEINLPDKSFEVSIFAKPTASEWLYEASYEIIKDFESIETVFFQRNYDLDQSIPLEQLAHNIIYRKNPTASFELLQSIKSSLDKDSYSDLEKAIFELLYPYTLSPHGYMKSLKAIDKKNLLAEIDELIYNLKSNGYPAFISSGTLLGALRNNEFIPHDDDIDLGVIMPGKNWEDLLKSIDNFEYFLKSKNLLRSNSIGLPNGLFHWKTKYMSGVNVDLFPLWEINEKFYAWPYAPGNLSLSDIFPLKSIELEGVKLPCPQNPNKFMVLNYGENWFIPDPAFKFDWKSATTKFSSFLKYVRLHRGTKI